MKLLNEIYIYKDFYLARMFELHGLNSQKIQKQQDIE